MIDYQKLWSIMEKNCGNIPKQLELLNNFIDLDLWFTMENYGTKEKTMVLWNKIIL